MVKEIITLPDYKSCVGKTIAHITDENIGPRTGIIIKFTDETYFAVKADTDSYDDDGVDVSFNYARRVPLSELADSTVVAFGLAPSEEHLRAERREAAEAIRAAYIQQEEDNLRKQYLLLKKKFEG